VLNICCCVLSVTRFHLPLLLLLLLQAPEHAWLSVVGVFDELYAIQQLSTPQVGRDTPWAPAPDALTTAAAAAACCKKPIGISPN
jgi:hypothetical protein